mgnify:CR=1 FL=1
MLVFLMSGVMCLFSTHDVHAQVPQTKRSEQDSFLKNIRAKKRNNDLQKARQGKEKSNQKKLESSLIRIRSLIGSTSTDSISASNSSLYLIWNNWGIGQTTENFLDTESGYIFDMKTHFLDLSYTIGSSWTMTLGAGVPSGNGKITTRSNTEYKSSTVSGNGYFVVIGLEIGIFEILMGYRANNVEFSNFETGSRILDTKYKISGSQSLIGLGLSF